MVTGRTGGSESGDDMDGGEVLISTVGGEASGSVRPFLFDPLASVGWRGKLKVSMKADWKVSFCEELSASSKDIMSIDCAKAVGIGPGSLGIAASCGDSIS
jgi:hypothetical protein